MKIMHWLRRSLAIIALIMPMAHAVAEPPVRQTRYHDSLDTLSRAAGQSGTPLGNGETVNSVNGNLEVTHGVGLRDRLSSSPFSPRCYPERVTKRGQFFLSPRAVSSRPRPPVSPRVLSAHELLSAR